MIDLKEMAAMADQEIRKAEIRTGLTRLELFRLIWQAVENRLCKGEKKL